MARDCIVLTGATGFIGRQLLPALCAKYEVIALHRRSTNAGLPSFPSLVWLPLADAHDGFASRRPLAVVHLATCYGHTEALSDVLSSNVVTPLRLVELAIANGCRLFVNTDTYFSKPALNYGHMRPYIDSKRAFVEWASHLLSGNSQLAFVNARLEHVYGPDDGAAKFVFTALDRLLKNQPLALSPGDQIRDFIHVTDVVEAYTAIVAQRHEMPPGLSELQIGTGAGHSIQQFVETAKVICGSSSLLDFGALPHRSGEIMASIADTTGLIALGWTARHTLHSGIASTVKAMRNANAEAVTAAAAAVDAAPASGHAEGTASTKDKRR